MELEELRKKLDGVDDGLLRLFQAVSYTHLRF